MWRKIITVLALLGLLIALKPPTLSPRGFTGEEEIPGQLLGLGHWLNTAVRPQPDLAPTAVVPVTDRPIFGMNTFLQNEVLPEVRAEVLRHLQDAGFSFVRQHFPWEDIEIHAKDDFIDRRNNPDGVDAWAKYDNIVELAQTHDIEIIARLDNPPAWSRAAGNENGTLAPRNRHNH